MSRPEIRTSAIQSEDTTDFDGTELHTVAGVRVEADREALFQLRNAVFAAYYDGDYDATRGAELRSLIPTPDDSTVAVTFDLSYDDASALRIALQTAAVVAEDDGRDATARRMNRHAQKVAPTVDSGSGEFVGEVDFGDAEIPA